MSKLNRCIVCVALIAATTFAAPSLRSQETKTDLTQQPLAFKRKISKTVAANYLLFLPKDYSAQKSKRWPLILFLHGAGERGTDVWKVAAHGPPKIVKEKPDFPFIVVSPQCPANQLWDNA